MQNSGIVAGVCLEPRTIFCGDVTLVGVPSKDVVLAHEKAVVLFEENGQFIVQTSKGAKTTWRSLRQGEVAFENACRSMEVFHHSAVKRITSLVFEKGLVCSTSEFPSVAEKETQSSSTSSLSEPVKSDTAPTAPSKKPKAKKLSSRAERPSKEAGTTNG